MGSAPQPRPGIRTPWPLALCPASLAARGHRAGRVAPGFAPVPRLQRAGGAAQGPPAARRQQCQAGCGEGRARVLLRPIPEPWASPCLVPAIRSVLSETGASVCLEDSGAAGALSMPTPSGSTLNSGAGNSLACATAVGPCSAAYCLRPWCPSPRKGGACHSLVAVPAAAWLAARAACIGRTVRATQPDKELAGPGPQPAAGKPVRAAAL